MDFPSTNSHLSALVRKCTAQHLANLVEKVGAARLLSGGKDLTERILPAVTKLAQDSSQETRFTYVFITFMLIHKDSMLIQALHTFQTYYELFSKTNTIENHAQKNELR